MPNLVELGYNIFFSGVAIIVIGFILLLIISAIYNIFSE